MAKEDGMIVEVVVPCAPHFGPVAEQYRGQDNGIGMLAVVL